jgi:hypothetical protein
MKSTIHEAYSVDPRTIPPTLKLVFCGDTAQETAVFLACNGGGIYKNALHKFQYRVAAKPPSRII